MGSITIHSPICEPLTILGVNPQICKQSESRITIKIGWTIGWGQTPPLNLKEFESSFLQRFPLTFNLFVPKVDSGEQWSTWLCLPLQYCQRRRSIVYSHFTVWFLHKEQQLSCMHRSSSSSLNLAHNWYSLGFSSRATILLQPDVLPGLSPLIQTNESSGFLRNFYQEMRYNEVLIVTANMSTESTTDF